MLQGKFAFEQGIIAASVSVHFLHTCFATNERDLFSLSI
jgi:hypothetical protein